MNFAVFVNKEINDENLLDFFKISQILKLR